MSSGRLAVLLAALTTTLLLLAAWAVDRAENDLFRTAELQQDSQVSSLALQLTRAAPNERQEVLDRQAEQQGGSFCLQSAGRLLTAGDNSCEQSSSAAARSLVQTSVGTLTVVPTLSTLKADTAQLRVTIYGVHLGLLLLLALLIWRLGSRQDDAVVGHVSTVLSELVQGDLSARIVVAGEGSTALLVERANAVADRLQVTVERQRTFLADAAHQLRNPLSALHLRAENLEPHVAPAGARGHARLLSDVARLERTLDELVVFARAHEQEADAQVVDVLAVVQERLLGWLPQAYDRNLRFRQLLPRQAVALCRAGALEQALDVLLDNALKHAPPGSEVTVLVVPSSTHVEVRVEDRGKGLPVGAREFAAQRGWRSDPRSNGSGLGLAIASLLITSSGGRLELADRTDGPGLSAVVRLPTPAIVLVDDTRPVWVRQDGPPHKD